MIGEVTSGPVVDAGMPRMMNFVKMLLVEMHELSSLSGRKAQAMVF